MRNVVYGASVTPLRTRASGRRASKRCTEPSDTIIVVKETIRRLMPPRALAVTLAGFAVALIPHGARGQRAELERRIQRTKLDNGLEVIVVENRGVPLVT